MLISLVISVTQFLIALCLWGYFVISMLLRETQTTTQHQRTKESSKKLQITESTVLILLTAPTAKTDLTSKSCKTGTQLFFYFFFFLVAWNMLRINWGLKLCLFCVCRYDWKQYLTETWLFSDLAFLKWLTLLITDFGSHWQNLIANQSYGTTPHTLKCRKLWK